MAKRRWKLEDIQAVLDGENPFVQIGYTNPKQRKEGDEWTDGKGITWRKTKNGIERVNKQMDAIRELVKPRCKKCKMDINLFGDKLDRKIHPKTGLCFDCLQEEEMILRITGDYAKYEQIKMEKNRLSALKDFRQKVKESIDFLKRDDAKIKWVTSNGDITTWTGAMNAKLLKEAEADLIKTENEIKRVEEWLEKNK